MLFMPGWIIGLRLRWKYWYKFGWWNNLPYEIKSFYCLGPLQIDCFFWHIESYREKWAIFRPVRYSRIVEGKERKGGINPPPISPKPNIRPVGQR